MTDSDTIQEKRNDEAYALLIAHLSNRVLARSMTYRQKGKAVERVLDAFNHHNTPHQTWIMLVNLASSHGLDLNNGARQS